MRADYIHQREDWPVFRYDLFGLAPVLSDVNALAGSLAAQLASLGMEDRQEAELDAAVAEIGSSSAIEGENLDRAQVRSSIARQLGFDVAGVSPIERDVEGVVTMALDATESHAAPLTADRLFGWHNVLFPSGRSGFFKIRVADWRDDRNGAMQVVSGPIGRERVHYEAPVAERVPAEMERFLIWLEHDDGTEARLKAGIAHLWFVTVHPFDDGNGRIGRAILDLGLSRAERSARRGYSVSTSILAAREAYYAILEETQKGDLDVTEYLAWYLDVTRVALKQGHRALERSLWRSRFWQRHHGTELNERQRRVLSLLLGEFKGGLSNTKWTRLTRTSHDTALRDLNDLVAKGLLTARGEGRGTRYVLTDAPPE